jgi:hypothetical protein
MKRNGGIGNNMWKHQRRGSSAYGGGVTYGLRAAAWASGGDNVRMKGGGWRRPAA